ncbi:MAG: transcriptional regulator, TetR family [Paenibacillus sp.]|nr:transcriptional regulator, TetR family [Paenibacillus sp.]
MGKKQEQRSEETKKNIIAAAGALFARKGYASVSMREIATEAGCSHTTIYIYFDDKEALLQELAIPPLQALAERMDALMKDAKLPPDDRLCRLGMMFVEFCLVNRSMYNLFFAVKSVRVDEPNPELAVNALRNALFGRLSNALRECLPSVADEAQQLQNARILFFLLHGMVATYAESEETAEQLLERLASTFSHGIRVALGGMKQLG